MCFIKENFFACTIHKLQCKKPTTYPFKLSYYLDTIISELVCFLPCFRKLYTQLNTLAEIRAFVNLRAFKKWMDRTSNLFICDEISVIKIYWLHSSHIRAIYLHLRRAVFLKRNKSFARGKRIKRSWKNLSDDNKETREREKERVISAKIESR